MKKEQEKKAKLNLSNGDEVTYTAHKLADPISLTYVERKKSGLLRFFSSEFPVQEYWLSDDDPKISTDDAGLAFEIKEKYLAFKGDDHAKQQAYLALTARRGQS